MRILLVDCTLPFENEVRNTNYETVRMPPVGLLALSSYITRSVEKDTFEFKVLDSTIDYKSLEELSKIITSFDPKVLGLRCMQYHTRQFHQILEMAKKLNPGLITVAGGPYANGNPISLLKLERNLDYVVKGEGEEIFLNFLTSIKSGKAVDSVKGLFYKEKDGTPGFAGENIQNQNLDSLGFPDWSEVDFSKYEKHISFAPILRKAAPILTSRGCPYKCTYCHDVFSKKLRVRSAGSILEELIMLSDLGVNDIIVIDDIFNLDHRRAFQIFNEIVRKNLKLRFYFSNGLRGDQMPDELIDAMVEGGTVQFIYALESGSKRIQKLVKKSLIFDKFERALSYTLSKNVMVDVFLMIGFPDETWEEIMETFKFILPHDGIGFPYLNILNAFEGTPIFSELMEKYTGVSDSANSGFFSIDQLNASSRNLTLAARMYLLKNYLLREKRLRTALDIQKKYLREDEIVAKYNQYFGVSNLKSIENILALAKTENSVQIGI